MGTPVLVETEVEKKLLEQKAEFKEKKMLSLQRKELKDQGHAKPDVTKHGFEMELRKIATQGVVRLFNTVQEFQSKHDDEAQRKETSKLPLKKRSPSKQSGRKEVVEKGAEKQLTLQEPSVLRPLLESLMAKCSTL